jgi:two-component system, LytTR family, sensor kinase
MIAEPQAQATPTPALDADADHAALPRSARASSSSAWTAGAALRPILIILTVFWVDIACSNVLYAYGMTAGLEAIRYGHLFAGWPARVLQHIFLYPVLVGCVLLSLRLGWQRWWTMVPVQLLLGLGFSILGTPLLVASQYLVHDPHLSQQPDPKTLAEFVSGPGPALWLASTTSGLLTYGFAVALVTGFAFYRRFRDAEARIADLERAWSAARLSALRSQLSPHTLFNLLHTIRGQISWDPRAAQSMVVQLGDLLRRLLSAGERDFSRLSEEIQFARLYLELQQKRFTDRLTLTLPASDALPDAWVPSLILQPLAENAVVHGLAGHEGPVTIRIDVEAQDGELALRVTNTMAQAKLVSRTGIGLRNVHERLGVQFGTRASLNATAVDAGTWVATIRLPLLRERP